MTKDEAIDICYKYKSIWLYESNLSQREFDCLINIIETSKNIEEDLMTHGMDYYQS